MELQENLEHLRPFTFGPDGYKQFYKHQDNVYCLRKTCDDCKFSSVCTFKTDKLEVDPSPNVRRALAVEPLDFLILEPIKPIEQIDILTLDQKLSLYPSNLHFVKHSPKDIFYIIKGQIRYYESEEHFKSSKYSQYFTIVKKYKPKHRLFSLDYSAIEPRLVTLVIREPSWIEVFSGQDKIVAKEIEISNTAQSYPSYIFSKNDKLYCLLSGELDKSDYSSQCSSCPLKDSCSVKLNYTRKVAGDWHSKNGEAFYGDEFVNQTDKYKKKDMRSDAKVGGLALIYGAYPKTLARSLNCSVEKAESLWNNFFKALPKVKLFMANQKVKSIKNKTVANMFNRHYNIAELVDNKSDQKFRFKAESISLNHPIQSLGADFLKLGLLDCTKYIRSKSLNVFSNVELSSKINILDESKVSVISTVHDEDVFLIDDNAVDTVIPELYKEMRLDYLLDKLKAGFYLEMDIEYDSFRSWTSSNRYETSKVFLINELNKDHSDAEVSEPNIILIKLEDISENQLEELLTHKSDTGTKVGIVYKEDVFISDFNIEQSKIKSLSIRHKLAFIKL